MSYHSHIVELRGEELVAPTVREICIGGKTPVVAIERALESYLCKVFIEAFAHTLVKLPVVRLHSMYFKERYASLSELVNSGYKTWYLEVAFSTLSNADIQSIDFQTELITIQGIRYGGDREIKTQLKKKRLKTRTRFELRISAISINGGVFEKVKSALDAEGLLQQPFIANFLCGPNIEGHRVVSFDDLVSGQRFFCDCAKRLHAKLRDEANRLRHEYVEGSWPHQLSDVLDSPQYREGICHLCIARNTSATEARIRYGESVEHQFDHYVDQLIVDESLDRTTASADVQQRLGLSRWVREATLYRVIKDLFPEHRVLREASPELLGRLRLDIYLPELKLAIEHQGEQHFRAIGAFGGDQAHLETLRRDQLKRERCAASGIELIEIRYDAPITKTALRHRIAKFIERANKLCSS